MINHPKISYIKQITGGDFVLTKRLHDPKDQINFNIILLANNLPIF